MENFKAGFVNIIGKPNVGKSTLMNVLVGERLSIITSKAQTTRHRIIGIVNGENFQIVFSDTPGIITDPAYKLQESMNEFVKGSIEDADVLIFLTDIFENPDEEFAWLDKVKQVDGYKIMVLNKIDLDKKEVTPELMEKWTSKGVFDEIIQISALENLNVNKLSESIMSHIPFHPPYYDKDSLTDKPEKFFVSEIIREKIFENYSQEIPYSTEVEVESFVEGEESIKIGAIIYVERLSQKGIIIGKGGEAIKKVRQNAQKSCTKFFDKKVHLELFVKVNENWRSDNRKLRNFGYLDN